MHTPTRHCTTAALFLCCALFAADASAQGFVPDKGTVWTKLGYSYGRATEAFAGQDERFFNERLGTGPTDVGARVPFRARNGQVVGGVAQINQLTLDAMFVPINKLVVGAHIPVLSRPSYSNTVNNYSTSTLGVADVRPYVGYQLTPQGGSVGVSAYVRGKIPTTFNFPYTNSAILGEGQFDLSGVLATTLKVTDSLQITATGEYVHRFAHDSSDDAASGAGNTDAGFANPGEEVHFGVSVGSGVIPGVWLTGSYQGMTGKEWDIQLLDGERRFWKRELHSVGVGAYVDASFIAQGLALDLWARAPIAGQDVADMRAFGVGVAYGFKLGE